MDILGKGFRKAGPDVTKWQTFLVGQGLNCPINALFDNDTDAATKAFQSAHGLKADGIVGNKTLGAAMTLGFKPLPELSEPQPSNKVVHIRTIGDVKFFKLADDKAIFFTSDMDVDADGCPRAYAPGNKGIEDLANATNKKTGKLSGDVIVLDESGAPFIQTSTDPAPGFFISQTALRSSRAVTHPEDPTCYIDALTVPYIVIPGGVTKARAGDAALVVNLDTGVRVKTIVGDVGGSDVTGEASIYCAGLISGLKPSEITETLARTRLSVIDPRKGGPKGSRFRYIIFPKTTMQWPQTLAQIEAQVDGVIDKLTADQFFAITT